MERASIHCFCLEQNTTVQLRTTRHINLLRQEKKNKRPNGISDAGEEYSFTVVIKYLPPALAEATIQKKTLAGRRKVSATLKLKLNRRPLQLCDRGTQNLCNIHLCPPSPIVSRPTTPRTACSRLCARCCVFLPFSFLSHSSDILAPSSEEGCGEPPTAEAIVGLTAGSSFATTPPPPPHPPKYFSIETMACC